MLAEILAHTAPPAAPPPAASSPAAALPRAPEVPSQRRVNGSTDGAGAPEVQMEKIAGSLEDVARRLRGRGMSALFRNEPDPLNQRLLRVIADHLSARVSG